LPPAVVEACAVLPAALPHQPDSGAENEAIADEVRVVLIIGDARRWPASIWAHQQAQYCLFGAAR
jgi:hypothetical protein